MTGRSQFVIDALDCIQLWAGGSPSLIELLGEHLIECLRLATIKEEVQLINDLVQRTIIDDWTRNTAATHLGEIESRLLSYSRVDSLLILYLKVLQRGETATENGAEQAVLLASGLVVKEGPTLRIANAIYRSVFDLDLLEQHVPGLTRPVSIVRLGALPFEGGRLEPVSVLESVDVFADRDLPRQSAFETEPFSKAIVLAGFMAIVVGAIATYAQVSNPRSLAADSSMTVVNLVQDVVTVAPTERQLFDTGSDHATNGRWLMMMREFCSIPKESAYFEPAERSMKQWISLYGEDIEAAKAAFVNESELSCAVMPQ